MQAPLNQGLFGTCTAHAAAQALSTGLQVKYGVICRSDVIVEKVKALCPCWDGRGLGVLVKNWNRVHDSEGAAIEDVDRRLLYNVKVATPIRQIDSFDEVYQELGRVEAQRRMIPCAIKAGAQGHDRHAVALVRCYPDSQKKMEALNSWGATQAYMDVTPSNFLSAVSFDVEIIRVRCGKRPEPVPPVREIYTACDQRLRDPREHAATVSGGKLGQLASAVAALKLHSAVDTVDTAGGTSAAETSAALYATAGFALCSACGGPMCAVESVAGATGLVVSAAASTAIAAGTVVASVLSVVGAASSAAVGGVGVAATAVAPFAAPAVATAFVVGSTAAVIVGATGTHVGPLPSHWVPNTERTQCKACKKVFDTRAWRHHCRACGEIFCNSCAPIRFGYQLRDRRCSECTKDQGECAVLCCD